MTTKLKEVDVVIVGLDWTGSILAKELTEAGMQVVALERGAPRSSETDYALPNIREALRARDYPLPPLTPILASAMFTEAARNAGYHPFPRPSANASQPYTNPDGSKFGGCQYCGYCQRFGCEANAKGSPHMTVIPIAMRNPNFELRTHAWVTKVLKDNDGKRVTGVAYTNVLNGEEFEQPANIVLLCAYAINNVHLMLLSGIGTPYDPDSSIRCTL